MTYTVIANTSEQIKSILAAAEKDEFNQRLLSKYYRGEYTWAEVQKLWKN